MLEERPPQPMPARIPVTSRRVCAKVSHRARNNFRPVKHSTKRIKNWAYDEAHAANLTARHEEKSTVLNPHLTDGRSFDDEDKKKTDDPERLPFRQNVIEKQDLRRLFMNTDADRHTVCVEISPQCAVTSVSRLNPPSVWSSLQMSTVLRYERTHYCPDPRPHLPRYSPADLLSGIPKQMERALQALVARRASELQIFYDGKLVVSNKMEVTPEIRRILDHGLGSITRRKGRRSKGNDPYDSRLCKDAMQVVKEILCLNTGVLLGIREEQSRDYIDSYGAFILFEELKHRLGCSDGTSADVSESEAWKIVRKYWTHESSPDGALLKAVEEAKAKLSFASAHRGEYEHDERTTRSRDAAVAYVKEAMSTEELAYVLAEFMTARAAMECSIKIPFHVVPKREGTVRPRAGEHCRRMRMGNEEIEFWMKVDDVEMMPMSMITEWKDRDRRDAVVAFEGRPLVDE